jgi:hypothetical protein
LLPIGQWKEVRSMPPRGVKSAKRARQYEHIKESAKKKGRSTKRAKEIAAATVNKQRRESGEARTSTTGGRKKASGRKTASRSNASNRKTATGRAKTTGRKKTSGGARKK